ncbi:hypothetical protein K439DRAFT_71950 [Ramaria rubella]|nr:hypothetical protein K439DRAFT_71950 [Ramaria rubella]
MANNTELTASWRITQDWLFSAGLSPDVMKWELAHYSCQHNTFTNEPSIWLPVANNVMFEVKAEHTVKWLGIYFDRKLTFNEHVKCMIGKAEKSINGLSMLANTVTYGSPIWWTGKKSHAAALDVTQNKALRRICASFKTTPVRALQIEAACPPSHLKLDLLSTQAAL